MVSKASEDLPEPESPVMTVSSIAGDADGDVLEVVLAGTADDEEFLGHSPESYPNPATASSG